MSSRLSIHKDARRICIYIGESDRWRGKPLYAALLETLKANGIAGATVIRGVAGYGAHSRLHTASILRLSEDLPLRIEVIDSPEKIEQAVEIITPMVREGLITVEDVQVIRYTHRYLNPLPADKPISEVMTSQVVMLSPEMSIAQAWELMLERRIKAMPVIDEQQHVIGMLTDGDLIQRADLTQRLSIAARLDAETMKEQLAVLHTSALKVADVMSKPVITVQVDDSLGVAAAWMTKHKIKRLPVVDAAAKLVGIIARVDVLRQVMNLEKKPPKLSLPKGAALTIDQVMYTEIPTVQLEADLAAVVAALVESGMRRLVVLDSDNRPVGLISDSDVVSRIQPSQRRSILAALRGGPPPSSNVMAGELMSRGVLTANPDTPLLEAAQQMLDLQRKWLVIVDGQGKALGLVDRQILLNAVIAR